MNFARSNNAASQNQIASARNGNPQKVENAANSQSEAIKNQNKNRQTGDLKKQIEQITKAANGRVVIAAAILEAAKLFRSIRADVFRCSAFINFRLR